MVPSWILAFTPSVVGLLLLVVAAILSVVLAKGPARWLAAAGFGVVAAMTVLWPIVFRVLAPTTLRAASQLGLVNSIISLITLAGWALVIAAGVGGFRWRRAQERRDSFPRP